MDTVSFETRFAVTLVFELVLALVLITRFVKTGPRRALALVALLVAFAVESAAYDMLWAPTTEQVEEIREDAAGRQMSVTFVTVASPLLGYTRTKAIFVHRHRSVGLTPYFALEDRGFTIRFPKGLAVDPVQGRGSIMLFDGGVQWTKPTRCPVFDDLWQTIPRMRTDGVWTTVRSLDRSRMSPGLRYMFELDRD